MIYESITDILYSSVFSSSNFLGKTRLRMTPMTRTRSVTAMLLRGTPLGESLAKIFGACPFLAKV